MIIKQVIRTLGVSLVVVILYHYAMFKSMTKPSEQLIDELAVGNERLQIFRKDWRNDDLPSGVPAAESIKLQLSKLVKGKDLTKLEATGFSCNSDKHTEVCVISKPVVFEKQSLTIFIPSDDQDIKTSERAIKPYARREDGACMDLVTPILLLNGNTGNIRPAACQFTHHVPAIIFSFGGYSDNLFHEINDIIIPLFITSRHFQSQVKFVITDYRGRFIRKFDKVFKQLSQYDIIDADVDDMVHCFPSAVVGLRYHDDLSLNSTLIPGGYTIETFRHFLWDTFNLKLSNILKNQKPKVLLLSRKSSRKILNEDEMVMMMEELGLQVHVASPNEMTNVDQFSKIVNSCDIMVGAHGAGLTNEIFLPDGAVVVQIQPLGLEFLAKRYYGKPAVKMGLKHLTYVVEPYETTLYDLYGPDSPVISDSAAVWARGFYTVKRIYHKQQDFKINVDRFKETLIEALKLLN